MPVSYHFHNAKVHIFFYIHIFFFLSFINKPLFMSILTRSFILFLNRNIAFLEGSFGSKYPHWDT